MCDMYYVSIYICAACAEFMRGIGASFPAHDSSYPDVSLCPLFIWSTLLADGEIL